MNNRMLINATQPDEVRVAITNNGILLDLDIEHHGQDQIKSNIYKGKITSIEPSLGAVFVNYGRERHGFLPVKEISSEYFLTEVPPNEEPDVHKILKLGQELVVQVDKEERGLKGAALTTFISLAGACLVLMPNNPHGGGISRRIEGDERDELRESVNQLQVPEGMSVIIRTAGVGKNTETLQWDLNVLLQYWEAIKQAAIARPGPYLIHQEGDVIIRAIRDNLRQEITEIIVDDAKAYECARNYISQVQPDFTNRLKLYSDHLPLFSRFQVEQQIENAYQREIRLPSGGSIVIDNTEALVSIDINSARATKGANIEETALNTNLEAADEIARQLRIRDIGGLVVIDFIDMTPVRNQREVENRLRYALRLDRARVQMGRISRFGLLEMSRQRLRTALNISTQIACPRCEGRGTIRSVESLSLSILHLIQEHASKSSTSITLQAQLPVDVATYLLNEKLDAIESIKKHSPISIVIIPNPHLESPQYSLKEVRGEHAKTIPSYKLARTAKPEMAPNKKPVPTKKASEPAIHQFLATQPERPQAKKPQGGGLIKRVWDLMFGGEEELAAPKKMPERTHERPHNKPRGKKHPQSNAPGQLRVSEKPRHKQGPKEHGQKEHVQREHPQREHPQKEHAQKEHGPKEHGQKGKTRRGQRGGKGNFQGQKPPQNPVSDDELLTQDIPEPQVKKEPNIEQFYSAESATAKPKFARPEQSTAVHEKPSENVEHKVEHKTEQPKVEQRPEQKVEHKAEQPKVEQRAEQKVEPKAEQPKVEQRAEQKVEHKAEAKSERKEETVPLYKDPNYKGLGHDDSKAGPLIQVTTKSKDSDKNN